jgi:hypothetical protein
VPAFCQIAVADQGPSQNLIQIQIDQTLHIDLSGLSNQSQSDLLFNLDGMDVSYFVQFSDQSADLVVPELQQAGSYQLTIYDVSGVELTELTQIDISVISPAKSPWQLDMSASIDLGFADSSNDTSSDRFVAEAGAYLSVERQHEGLNTTATVNLLASNNDHNEQINFYAGDETSNPAVDLGNYLVSTEKGDVHARFGDHRIQANGLIVGAINRRGTSMSWQPEAGRLSVVGFGLSSRPARGWNNISGLNDSSDRIFGGVFTAQPFSGSAQDISLDLIWVEGETTGYHSYLNNEEFASDGKSQGLRLTSGVANQSMQLSAEYAQSKFSFAQGSDAGQDSDDAWNISAKHQPFSGATTSNGFHQLDLSFEHREIGTFFRSHANPGLFSDVRSSRAELSYYRDSLNVFAALESQQNNVDNLPLPTYRTRSGSMYLSYAGTIMPERVTDILGEPTLSFSWDRSKTDYLSGYDENFDQGNNTSTRSM